MKIPADKHSKVFPHAVRFAVPKSRKVEPTDGICIVCGATGLTKEDAKKQCANPHNITAAEVFDIIQADGYKRMN